MQRDIRFDFGRCIAALFVICVHNTMGDVVSYGKDLPTAEWLLAVALNMIGRSAVPLFLMMSGALILDKPIGPWRGFMYRRLATTMKPYLLGAVFYFLWTKYYLGQQPASLYAYAQQFLAGAAAFHLYFLFVLLGMYIIAPLLQGVRDSPADGIRGATVIMFILGAVELFMSGYGLSLGYLSIGTCYTFLPYFLSGHLLNHSRSPAWRPWLAIFCVAACVNISLVWIASVLGKFSGSNSFLWYASPNIIVQSIAAFQLLRCVDFENVTVRATLTSLSKLTLGVYVIHYAVLVHEYQWISSFGSLTRLIMLPFLVFMTSAAVIRILHMVPGVKGFL